MENYTILYNLPYNQKKKKNNLWYIHIIYYIFIFNIVYLENIFIFAIKKIICN